MAATAPVRDGPPAGSCTGGDSRLATTSTTSTTTTTTTTPTPTSTTTTTTTNVSVSSSSSTTNFEYDDNEWEIGIGNLIIDLDADIEKTNEKGNNNGNVGNLTSSSAGGLMAAAPTANAASSNSSSSSSSSSNSSSNANKSTKTNNNSGGGIPFGSCSSSSTSATSVDMEHSTTIESKSLKMKIKRTKSSSKSSEKHEIVKSNEQNGSESAGIATNAADAKSASASTTKHSTPITPSSSVNSGNSSTSSSTVCGSVSGNGGVAPNNGAQTSATVNSGSNKRGTGSSSSGNSSSSSSSSGSGSSSSTNSSHRRDKNKEKHCNSGGEKATKCSATSGLQISSNTSAPSTSTTSGMSADNNSVVRTPLQRIPYPSQTNGLGPPLSPSKDAKTTSSGAESPQNSSAPVTNATSAVANATSLKSSATSNAGGTIENGCSTSVGAMIGSSMNDNLLHPSSPGCPPNKKIKTGNCLNNENTDTKDACVGTSISTMTEPDCLGPCEPGTSVTLEGIVWHETEGVLVVNVTWRGKTYVGTLLDCTRHDWAPPRFCDSPTSDLDTRLPKSRAKRGRTSSSEFNNYPETRSSIHSKLRSSSSGSNKSTRKGLSNSPTPFVSPRPDVVANKRKTRPSEEDSASPQANGKKCKSSTSLVSSVSPPASPVLFECPETNCCKKYKHLNGLKYHQSHAHGGACGADDDDATKESTSMSETEEMPSPTDPQSIKSERKDENSESEPATPVNPVCESSSATLGVPNLPLTDDSPCSISEAEPVRVEFTPPSVDNKNVVKLGVLRYGVPVDVDGDVSQNNAANTPANSLQSATATALVNQESPRSSSNLAVSQISSASPPSPLTSQQIPLSPTAIPAHYSLVSQEGQSQPLNATTTTTTKLPQFKVKPSSALLQEDKLRDQEEEDAKCQIPKKKSKRSASDSPQSMELSRYKLENSDKEEVHSPAYSDISDDGAPVLEAEMANLKTKTIPVDKKSSESSSDAQSSPHAMQHYNMYPFYAQPPYLVASVQSEKVKEEIKSEDDKVPEKEKKDEPVAHNMFAPNYYPYESNMGNYGYNFPQNYPISMVASTGDKEIKEESKSPGPTDLVKQPQPNAHSIQNLSMYQNNSSSKVKDASAKVPNDPYANVKEIPEARSPLNASTVYPSSRQSTPQQQQQQQQPQHMQHSQSSSQTSLRLQQQQIHDDMRKYYETMYSEHRRKEQHHAETPLKANHLANSKTGTSMSSSKHKEKQSESKKEAADKVKQEGVKPTMETQGPPPPPTSSYTYFHPSSYLQPPYVPYDPAAHSVYRGINQMIMPTGPYGNSPYLHHPAQMHHQIPRFHAHEDLSRSPSGSATKALDLLHHQASQYYPPSHKIHELQERALKSPTSKGLTSNSTMPTNVINGQATGMGGNQMMPPSTGERHSTGASSQPAKSAMDGKDSRSPPPQRHVHTHHHTHVGLGYPLLTAQYPAPYGAAVLASEQAGAVASAGSNPYSPK